ncbi:hypothetical protein ISS22_12700 [candidate division KSB1 bacterium]|nr:hypothetical protein [candidate division KSB1 bacterium]
MKQNRNRSIFNIFLVFLIQVPMILNSQPKNNYFLKQEFDLAGNHTEETQYFEMKSKLITLALDGKRIGTDIFRLYLKYNPSRNGIQEAGKYTCVHFSLQLVDSPEVEIPALRNWTYIFNDTTGNKKEQVFGIDHEKFENLIDSEGNPLPFDKAYHVYNAFIDFHAFCNIFAESAPDGKGIQDLRKINQKIIHDAAFSEPQTNLGKNISEGSFFKNGEITLEFKGLSVVNEKQCALIGVDSGESAFKMIMHPAENMEIITVGSSHYKGDIYKDLVSNWVQKVTFDEMVVAETKLNVPPHKINSVIERSICIKNIGNVKM